MVFSLCTIGFDMHEKPFYLCELLVHASLLKNRNQGTLTHRTSYVEINAS